jgi:hypothetical protein
VKVGSIFTNFPETPLSIAVLNSDIDMILLIVEFGAFLDYRVGSKEFWKTPLHLAAQHNKPHALQKLLSLGAWVNAVDVIGLPALAYAVQHDHPECAHRLLLARADTNLEQENQKTMLHQSCINNFEFTCALLIDFGANLNAQNITGNTPLHIAATRNSKGCIKWLLTRGAAQDVLNKTGHVASSIAASVEIKEYMENFTADQQGLKKINDIVEPYPPPFKYTDNAEYPFSFQTMYAPNSPIGPNVITRMSIMNTESVKSNLNNALISPDSGGPRESLAVRRTRSTSHGGDNKPDNTPPSTFLETSLTSNTMKSGSIGKIAKKSMIPPPPTGPPPLPKVTASMLKRGNTAPKESQSPQEAVLAERIKRAREKELKVLRDNAIEKRLSTMP